MRALADILILAAFVWCFWMPIGRALQEKLRIDSPDRGAAAAMALGMGAWGMCVLLLGSCGLLHAPALLAAALLLHLSLGAYRRLEGEGLFGPDGHGGRAFPIAAAAVACCYLGIGMGSSLAPELSFDALNVHLPYARDAAASGRAGFAGNNWSSAMPALPLMTYITAFALSGATLAKLFNFAAYAACGGAAYWFAARTWGRVHGAAAALLFLSCPVAIYEATTALIDLPLTLFSSLAVLSLLRWTTRRRDSLLWLSAVMMGLACGCKYHAAFWLLPAVVVVLWHSLIHERRGYRRAAALGARYLLVVFLLSVPWLFRAWYFTGNPVFPLANSYFRSPFFPPAMEEAARAMYASEGVGTSLRALILLPLTVTFDPAPFRGTPGIVFLPGILLALWRVRAPHIRAAAVLAAAYFYTWALTAQEIRYLLPLVPLLAVMAAAGLLGAVETGGIAGAAGGGRVERWLRAAGMAAVLASALMSIPPVYEIWAPEWTYWHGYRSPLPYLLGRESRQEYLIRDVPSIHVYDFINRSLGAGSRILLLNDAFQFYSSVPTLYSFTVEGEGILKETTEQGVLEKLRGSRISHVLLNYNGIAPLPGVEPRRGAFYFLDPGFQARHLEPIFSANNVTLYRVRT